MKITDSLSPLPHGKLACASGWKAQLALGFADDKGVTRLVKRTHNGPLRVQKPLYPEGGRVCHAIIVHPPGGVVGGDELFIDAEAGPGAHAFVTTPGAAKWYKANGKVSVQQVKLAVSEGATLEWLPQETIFFNAAQVQLDTDITLGKDARFIGCEILCFGRTASGESFTSGRIGQRNSIWHDGKLIWFEQGMLAADGAMMHSPMGLGGRTVCATVIAAGKVLPATLIAELREALAHTVQENDIYGVTQLKNITVVRCMSQSSECAKRIVTLAWQVLRPALLGCPAVVPRIWNT